MEILNQVYQRGLIPTQLPLLDPFTPYGVRPYPLQSETTPSQKPLGGYRYGKSRLFLYNFFVIPFSKHY